MRSLVALALLSNLGISHAASLTSTTTKLTSSASSSSYGTSVTLTATVSASKATGSVTFNDGTAALGTSTLTGGTATLAISTLSQGTHSLTAVYGGDTSYSSSTSAALTETIGPASTGITLKSSANPASYGQSVTLTATLAPTTATGTVTFNDGTTALGTSSVYQGIASITVTNLAIGKHSLTAVYAGDTRDPGNTSAAVNQTVSQAKATITLTSSANPGGVGQNITLTATVTPSAATGNITFKDGSTTLGSSTLAGGIATLALSTLAVGAHSLTAAYAGDSNDSTGTSSALSQTITQSSTITLTSSANPATVGQALTLTATLSPTSATGSVGFMDGTTAIGTSTLSAGTATLSVTTLAMGTHSLSAVYSGDKNDAAGTSAALAETISLATTTATLSASPNPSNPGQSVTLTATVSPAAATGTITFKDGASTLGTGTLASGTATLSLTTLASGTHSLSAAYSGDKSDAAGTSAVVSQTVNQTTTTTTLNSSPNPASAGQSVTLAATVSPSTATGTVTFKDGASTIGSGTLSGGTVSFSAASLAAGTHTLTAVYAGDTNDSGSTSSAVTQTVNQAISTMTLISSPNPSNPGQMVTLTATVSPASATGSVTFKDGAVTLGSGLLRSGMATLTLTTLSTGSHPLTVSYGGDANDSASNSSTLMQTVDLATTTTNLNSSRNPAIYGQGITLTATVSPSTATGSITFQDGASMLGSGTLAGGIATLSLTALSTGAHALTAVYSGDANNTPSTSSTLSQTVNPGPTTTTLISSPNPAGYGQTLILTAAVSAGTGSITFMDGTNALGASPLIGSFATLMLTSLTTGTHSLTAVYSGDANNASSTSSAVSETVMQAATTTTLSSSPNPAAYGQSVVLAATVLPSGTGTVTFMDGSNALGSSPLSSGSAMLNLTSIAAGTHSFTAIYSGDSNDAASTSAPLTQTVSPAFTTTILTSSSNPSSPGQSVTLTATVAPSGTGSITFNDGSTALGSSSLAGGIATLVVTTLTAGTHAITASYSGDANNSPSSSIILVETVSGMSLASPCAPTFSYTIGQSAPAPTVCQLTSPPSPTAIITTNASWLQVSPSGGTLSVAVNPSGLSAGSYSANITVADPQLGSLTIAVQLAVAGGVSSTLVATPSSLTFSYPQGASTQNLTISSTNETQLPISFAIGGGAWLTASINAGTTPQPLTIAVNPSALSPGTYTATLTVSSPGVPSLVVNVSLTVAAAAPPQMSANASPINLSAVTGGTPATTQIPITNAGGGTLTYTATTDGSAWLSVSSLQPLVVTADPTSVIPGTYQGSITVAADTTVTIPVNFTVFAPAPLILPSESTLTFTAVAQGGVPLPQPVTILNSGTGSLNWTAVASTSTGDPWLLFSATSGTIQQPFVDVSSVIAVSIDPIVAPSLTPGTYYGQITLSDDADPAANSPQSIAVTLNMLPPGSTPGPEVYPASLIFTSQSPQSVTINTRNASGDQYLSVLSGSGFTYSPAAAGLAPDQPVTLQVTPPATSGQGAITLQFSDGTVSTINLVSLAPAPGSNGCTSLNLAWLAPASNAITVTQGLAQTLELQIFDNCGNAIGTGSVVAAFSNQDAPVNLVPIGSGVWSGAWQPMNPSSTPVAINVTAVNATATGQAPALSATLLPAVQ